MMWFLLAVIVSAIVIIVGLRQGDTLFGPAIGRGHDGNRVGPVLTLTADSLRTSGADIDGAATGLNPETMAQAYGQIVQCAQDGTLQK